MDRLAGLSALTGGAVLCALIAMTCASIAGRAAGPLGGGSVPGDFEPIELGVAFVVLALLPLAHLRGPRPAPGAGPRAPPRSARGRSPSSRAGHRAGGARVGHARLARGAGGHRRHRRQHRDDLLHRAGRGFLAPARVPQTPSGFGVEQGGGPWAVLSIILLVYLLLGCVTDSLSMIPLTVPIFHPVLVTLDLGPGTQELAIWLGILVLIIVEAGPITPPVGMNPFIVNGADSETPIGETYRAVAWFVASDILRAILPAAFPAISPFAIS